MHPKAAAVAAARVQHGTVHSRPQQRVARTPRTLSTRMAQRSYGLSGSLISCTICGDPPGAGSAAAWLGGCGGQGAGGRNATPSTGRQPRRWLPWACPAARTSFLFTSPS